MEATAPVQRKSPKLEEPHQVAKTVSSPTAGESGAQQQISELAGGMGVGIQWENQFSASALGNADATSKEGAVAEGITHNPPTSTGDLMPPNIDPAPSISSAVQSETDPIVSSGSGPTDAPADIAGNPVDTQQSSTQEFHPPGRRRQPPPGARDARAVAASRNAAGIPYVAPSDFQNGSSHANGVLQPSAVPYSNSGTPQSNFVPLDTSLSFNNPQALPQPQTSPSTYGPVADSGTTTTAEFRRSSSSSISTLRTVPEASQHRSVVPPSSQSQSQPRSISEQSTPHGVPNIPSNEGEGSSRPNPIGADQVKKPPASPPLLDGPGSQSRCFWAIFTYSSSSSAPSSQPAGSSSQSPPATLHFAFLDPNLRTRLHTSGAGYGNGHGHSQDETSENPEGDALIGRDMWDLVKEEDRERTRKEIMDFLSNSRSTPSEKGGPTRGSLGCMVRCSIRRLPSIRSFLQEADGTKLDVPTDYLPVMLTASWISESSVICFFHSYAEGYAPGTQSHWTNWCGPDFALPSSTYFAPQRLAALNGVLNHAFGTAPRDPERAPSFIFQIFDTPTGRLLFTYPPTSLPLPDQTDVVGISGDGFPDVSHKAPYLPEAYACRARKVLKTRATEHDVKGNNTSCTTRWTTEDVMAHPGVSDTPYKLFYVMFRYGAVSFAIFEPCGALLREMPPDSDVNMNLVSTFPSRTSGAMSSAHHRSLSPSPFFYTPPSPPGHARAVIPRKRAFSPDGGPHPAGLAALEDAALLASGIHPNKRIRPERAFHGSEPYSLQGLGFGGVIDPALASAGQRFGGAMNHNNNDPTIAPPPSDHGDSPPGSMHEFGSQDTPNRGSFSPAMVGSPSYGPPPHELGSMPPGPHRPLPPVAPLDVVAARQWAGTGPGTPTSGYSFHEALSPTIASASAILGSFQNQAFNEMGGIGGIPVDQGGSLGGSPNPSDGSGAFGLEFAPGASAGPSNNYGHPYPGVATSSGEQWGYGRGFSSGGLHNLANMASVGDQNSLGQNNTTALNTSPQVGRGQPAPPDPSSSRMSRRSRAKQDRACSSCGTTNSPEWRKGPTGNKTLCNACGLRFSRAQARQKKKTDIAGVAPAKGKKQKNAGGGVASSSAPDDAEVSPSQFPSAPSGSTYFEEYGTNQHGLGYPDFNPPASDPSDFTHEAYDPSLRNFPPQDTKWEQFDEARAASSS